MSTANFYTMEKYPLYAIGSQDFYYEDEETGEKFYDEFLADEFYQEVNNMIEEYNENLLFHKISIKSGYYDGMQLYVETIHDELEDIEKYWNNEDCKYQFDMCKSLTIRKFNSEINKVNKILKLIAESNGMIKYGVYARFSNGETWYTKVS